LLRQYIVIAPGTYTAGAAIAVSDNLTMIGRGALRPVVTRAGTGPILTVTGVAHLALDNVEISGATAASADGIGISCDGVSPSLLVTASVVQNNASDGIYARQCQIEVRGTEFAHNGDYAIEVSDANAIVDRCNVHENGGGVFLDGGTDTVTNNFIVRNTHVAGAGTYGLEVSSTSGGHRVEFNTIADNATQTAGGGGVSCGLSSGSAALANNLIVRNRQNTIVLGNCTFPGSIILDDASSLLFVSPDSPPYDYHLMAGSYAIDQGTVSTITVDFDGQPRPAGAANDVGADEVQ
jgi:hypothetical protein